METITHRSEPTNYSPDQLEVLNQINANLNSLNEQVKVLAKLVTAASISTNKPQVHRLGVYLADLNIPFGSLIDLLFKLALASIPVGIVLGIIFAILQACLMGL